MRERLFRFKQFSVCHQNSAMKIGVDAVLLGAWIDVNNCNTFLDVGCGCGVISLMIAQRSQDAIISGIDIDKLSVEESVYNAINTEWSDRLSFELKDYMALNGAKYDHIVSNPPYYDDGVEDISTLRLKARHTTDDGLSPLNLISKGATLLNECGKISLICPVKWEEDLILEAEKNGLYLTRLTYIKGNPNAPFKRIMIEFSKNKYNCQTSNLILEKERGVPTDEYRILTKDFYLKF